MFKLVVLFALVAAALARPSHFESAVPLTYGVAPAVTYASQPIVTGYSAYSPSIGYASYSAPVGVSYNAVVKSVPTAVSSTYRTDVHSKPAVVAAVPTYYSAPSVVSAYHGLPAYGYGYSGAYAW